jgi:uncharacterized protein (TIGR03437 family)
VLKDSLPLNTVTAAGAVTTPGVFAIVNQDGTINAANNPAPAGSTLIVFMTGAGLMQPQVETGSIGKGQSRIAAKLSMSLRGFVAGKAIVVPLEIAYAGDAPTSVQGLVQINARMPGVLPDVAPGASSFLDIAMGESDVVSVPVRFTPQASI